MKEKRETKAYLKEKGITLIALVITIVILVTLVAVSIRAVFSSKTVDYAVNGSQDYTEQAKHENEVLGQAENIMDNALANLDTGNGGNSNGGSTSSDSVTVIADGTTETLTKDNFAKYLGRIVTNYVGSTNIMQGGDNYRTYCEVSSTYRLYYVDWDGKYGEKGTIYLKADASSEDYRLGLSSVQSSTSKIKELNPALNDGGYFEQETYTNGARAAAWLLDTEVWKELIPVGMEEYVNYVVGAPSLEMMIDSYNTYYNLTDEEAYTSFEFSKNWTKRTMLFCSYTAGDSGYMVGPYSSSEKYDWSTGDYTVAVDGDSSMTMYNGDSTADGYWLASPSKWAETVMGTCYWNYSSQAIRGNDWDEDYPYCFCPLVSLKAGFVLTFE